MDWTNLFLQCFFFNRHRAPVHSCLYPPSVYSASLFGLCMISSRPFLMQGNALLREWLGKSCSFIYLCLCLRKTFVVWTCFSAWLSLSGPFQRSHKLCLRINIWSLIVDVLKCERLFLSAGLAHWHAADPHPVVMAAGPGRGHPQLRPPVHCPRVPPGNTSLRSCRAAGTQLEVGPPLISLNSLILVLQLWTTNL